jgi:putative endonuclease
LAGEEIAARYLEGEGWCLLGRRLQTPFGEVDLLAQCGGKLVCVEVKTGLMPPRAFWRPAMRLNARALARRRAAAAYLARAGSLGAGIRPARVDLIEVTVRGREIRIEHQVAL